VTETLLSATLAASMASTISHIPSPELIFNPKNIGCKATFHKTTHQSFANFPTFNKTTILFYAQLKKTLMSPCSP
jgi:hypothetical protein